MIQWLITHGIKIAVILIVALIINQVGRKFIEKAIKKGVKDTTGEATKKRQKTLIRIFSGALRISVWIIVVMTILPELGINVGPILAGAGILGVALGFGAQYMIRDFLAGLFVILENQYRVGDVICLDGTCGGVEDISLRKTTLRDLDGILHHIPNGEIKKASNLSKGFSRVHLNIQVAYKEDLDRVINVLNKVGEELSQDPEWKDKLLEEPITKSRAPKVLGVDKFGDNGITIKMIGSTKPLRQWDTARELRKRIKKVFDQEGIEIPFPQVSIWPRGKQEK